MKANINAIADSRVHVNVGKPNKCVNISANMITPILKSGPQNLTQPTIPAE